MQSGRNTGFVRFVVLLLVWGSVGTGCLAMLFGRPKVKSDTYTLDPPPLPWRKIDAGTSDRAYQQPDDRATISLNSVCGQYQDQTLEDLTRNMSLGLTDSRVATVEKFAAGGFPALKTIVEGSLQDVSVTVSLIVLRSTDCVYDFMLVARSATFAEHQQTYADLVSGFREESGP